MSGTHQIITGRQVAAGRTLAGIGQEELATRAGVSVPALQRMESSAGAAQGLPNNVAAVRAALEAAGIIFVAEDGDGIGVRLRKKLETAAELTRRIDILENDLAGTRGESPQTPEGGMRTLERAHKRNVVTKLKNRRTNLGKSKK